jgi:hypothetical protein
MLFLGRFSMSRNHYLKTSLQDIKSGFPFRVFLETHLTIPDFKVLEERINQNRLPRVHLILTL